MRLKRFSFNSSPIGRRLIVAIILFSSFITLVITTVQLYRDYKGDLNAIYEEIDSIRYDHAALSHSIWVFDPAATQIILDSLVKHPDIEHLRVVVDDETSWESGKAISRRLILETIPLTYRSGENNQKIGTLKITASLDTLYGRLLKKAFFILGSNAIKTFLVALFAFVVFQYLVTRHLIKIGNYTQHLQPGESTAPIALDRKQKPNALPDELDHVVTAINSMQIRLGEEIEQLKDTRAKLIQAQKMEAIGNLAGGIAHDFNNILAAIIGFTELALDEVERNSDLDDNLQEVFTASKRAKELVQQILSFARKSNEERSPLQPGKIAGEVLQLIRSTIPTTIEIRQEIHSDAQVMASAPQLHRLLMNLCTNAVQAMEEQGGILTLSLKDVTIDSADRSTGMQPGNYIQIRVSDTGVGIPPDIIDSIFDPYFTTKEFGKGTGMGIAVAHGIVENYGGKITVDSQLGKGATFTIILPVTEKQAPQGDSAPEKLPTGTERILLVDDEAPIARFGSQILNRLGYLVTTRTSSLEAFELFRENPDAFELVITDMTMPNLTGDKLAIELMKIRPDIPVILCTGYQKSIYGELVDEIGIKAFAYKPIIIADFAKTVRKVLDEAKG